MVFNNISLLKIADPSYDGFVYLLSLRSVMTINIEVIADLLLLPSCLHSVSFDWIPIWFGFIYSKLRNRWGHDFLEIFHQRLLRPTLCKVHMFWEGHKNLTKIFLIWISFKVQVFKFCGLLSKSIQLGDFLIFLWPSQKTYPYGLKIHAW